MKASALRKALEIFRGQHARGIFPGGQISVRWRGELVLSEAIGIARGLRPSENTPPEAVDRKTQFCIWSSSKPVVAMAVALLDERGKLDVNAPISSLIPELAGKGRDQITTLDVLTHRSGMIVPGVGQDWDDWHDWDRTLAKLYSAAPKFPRGTLVYHPFEYGFLLGEIVRRAAGRPLDEFVRDEITDPAGLERLRFRVREDEAGSVARSYNLAKKAVYVSGVRFDAAYEAASAGLLITSLVPGGSMITDADTLSAFYELLISGGVAANGTRIFSPATVDTYTRHHVTAWDRMNRILFTFGRGFHLGAWFPSLYGFWGSSDCFGHGGAVSCLGFGDRSRDLSVAVITNGNHSINEFALRFMRLSHAIRGAFPRN